MGLRSRAHKADRPVCPAIVTKGGCLTRHLVAHPHHIANRQTQNKSTISHTQQGVFQTPLHTTATRHMSPQRLHVPGYTAPCPPGIRLTTPIANVSASQLSQTPTPPRPHNPDSDLPTTKLQAATCGGSTCGDAECAPNGTCIMIPSQTLKIFDTQRIFRIFAPLIRHREKTQ